MGDWTKGPWIYLADGPRAFREQDRMPNYRSLVAGCEYFDYESGTGFLLSGFMSDADGKLLAAAPDLAKACRASHAPSYARTPNR